MDTDALMAELAGAAGDSEITDLRHVRSTAEKRAAEEIANREPCPDFDRFKPLFEQVRIDLDSGVRITRQFVKDAGFLKADITEGQRSEERRVGKEWGSTCRFRGSPGH